MSKYEKGDDIPIEEFKTVTEIGDMDRPSKIEDTFVVTKVGMTGEDKHAYAIMRRLNAQSDQERFQVLLDPSRRKSLEAGVEVEHPTMCCVSALVEGKTDEWEPVLPQGRQTEAGPRLYHAVFLLAADGVKVGKSPKSVLADLIDEAKARAKAEA